LTSECTLKYITPREMRNTPMSTEQLTPTATPTDAAAASERGLLLAMLVMVLLGVGAMLLMA
jgi:hypothetical protein